MNINSLGIRARITVGLALILLLAVLSAANSLYRNISVKYESGEVAGSWIPAIENLGHMKGFVADHYLMVSDRVAGRDPSDAAAFAAKLQSVETELGKAVTQMDQVTQQNAALVEQMAATASGLKA